MKVPNGHEYRVPDRFAREPVRFEIVQSPDDLGVDAPRELIRRPGVPRHRPAPLREGAKHRVDLQRETSRVGLCEGRIDLRDGLARDRVRGVGLCGIERMFSPVEESPEEKPRKADSGRDPDPALTILKNPEVDNFSNSTRRR